MRNKVSEPGEVASSNNQSAVHAEIIIPECCLKHNCMYQGEMLYYMLILIVILHVGARHVRGEGVGHIARYGRKCTTDMAALGQRKYLVADSTISSMHD